MNSRTMEHMRRVGVERHMQDKSYPRNQPLSVCLSSSFIDTTPVFQQKFSSWGDAVDGLSDREMLLGFNIKDTVCPSILCPQFNQESVLKEHLDASPEAKIMWGCMVSSIVEDEQGVTVTMIDADELSSQKTVRAKYAVACDGGRSWVRKQLGIHNVGQFVVQRACSITYNSPELTKQLQDADRLGLTLIVNKTIRGVMVALNTMGDFAFHILMPPSTSDEKMNEVVRNAKYYVLAGIGKQVELTIKDAHSYNMHALMATQYRVGRVFLAGDAAHQWLPAGGIGLNTGYQDTADLGWKLAAMVHGWGGPHLLDSFQVERRPIADQGRRYALGLAGALLNPAFQTIVPVVITNPMSKFVMQLFFNGVLSGQFNLGSDIIFGYQYSDSNIIVHEFEDDADEPNLVKTPKRTTNKFVPSSLPGCRAPHIVLPESATIHDIFGKGFVLLVIGGNESDCKTLQEQFQNRGVPFEVRAYPKLPELLEHYDRKYYLIRSDGTIAWRSDSQPSTNQAENVVMTVCGDLPYNPFPKIALQDPIPSFSFLTDVSIGLWSTCMLKRYTDLPNMTVAGIGLGVASLSTILRSSAVPSVFLQQVSRHQAWLTTKYGAANTALMFEDKYVRNVGPKDVVIKVHAASINPIDIKIREGYRATLLAKQAKKECRSIFPIVLGRDCSGEVVAVGDDVQDFAAGDQVYAAVPITHLGTHSQYAVVNDNCVYLKPTNINHREAASLPWVAVTAWNAIVKMAGLNEHNTRGKRVLVHAGAGGVGSFAIQMLKSWGAEVTTTCSKSNFSFVHNLGADIAIDYESGDFASGLNKRSYDLVLNTIGHNYEHPSLPLLKLYSDSKYISLQSPNMDKYGTFFGQFLFQWYYRYKILVNRVFGGRGLFYSIAQPDGEALKKVKEMVEVGDIRPVIAAVYSMDEMIAAHQHVESGHTNGKVVVSFV